MRGFRADNLASKRTTARAATATIGSGADGTVTVTATTAGVEIQEAQRIADALSETLATLGTRF